MLEHALSDPETAVLLRRALTGPVLPFVAGACNTPASDVSAGTFGSDCSETGDYSFPANLGVGTSSPTGIGGGYRNLVVKGGAGGSLFLTDSSDTVKGTISTDNSGGNALFMDTRTAHPIVFRPNLAERMPSRPPAPSASAPQARPTSFRLAATPRARYGWSATRPPIPRATI